MHESTKSANKRQKKNKTKSKKYKYEKQIGNQWKNIMNYHIMCIYTRIYVYNTYFILILYEIVLGGMSAQSASY